MLVSRRCQSGPYKIHFNWGELTGKEAALVNGIPQRTPQDIPDLKRECLAAKQIPGRLPGVEPAAEPAEPLEIRREGE